MGRDATKAAGNPWYQARKKAAEYDDRLCSRESAAEQLNDVEAVKNDLGVRETVVNDREVRRIHIHTHGFNGFAGFPGIAHEIADESGHSAIRKDIKDLTGFRVKKEKRH